MTASPRRSTTLTALAALAGLLVATAPAGAATYTVFSCRGPDGAPVSTRAWQADAGDAGVSDTCAAGGADAALSATLGSHGSGRQELSGLRFMAPPGTVIAGYRVHLTAATGGAPGPGDLQAGLAAGSLLGPPLVTAGCLVADCTFGDPGDPLAEGNLITASGLPNPALALVAACGSPPACQGDDDKVVAQARLWRSAVDVLDEQAPQLGAAFGSLLGPGAASGRAVIGAAASDAGGGVADVTLRIDGAQVARAAAGGACSRPYDVVAPCPATLPASFEVDTRALADGPHVAELHVTDAAEQTGSSGPVPFSVSNAGAGSGGGAGGGAGAAPLVQVAPLAPASVRVDLARTRFTLPAPGGRITGVVRRADGTPAAGVQLDVRGRRFGGGDPPSRSERTLRTDAAGAFSFPVGATSRRLIVRVDDPAYRHADSEEVRVFGRLRVALEVRGKGLRNGSTMTLQAMIEGAGSGASAGRLLQVQAVVGGRWATVDSVEADGRGRASWRYRFRGTTRAAEYRFRVRVLREAGTWPWPTTTSPSVSVRVRP